MSDFLNGIGRGFAQGMMWNMFGFNPMMNGMYCSGLPFWGVPTMNTSFFMYPNMTMAPPNIYGFMPMLNQQSGNLCLFV